MSVFISDKVTKMKQQTLAMAADAPSGFEQHRKPARRDELLKTMEALVPWSALCEEIRAWWPTCGCAQAIAD
jgi:transposase, IS5 family